MRVVDMEGSDSDAVEGMNNRSTSSDDVLDLPPGFRFHPTDEEVVSHYLTSKVLDPEFTAAAIADVDLNKCEPWDMPARAKIGEKDWYFFCQKDRKYPTGTRTNRATKAGYWKATGKDKEIYKGRRMLVGMKKTLVFYKGRAPKGVKTNWVMHEFRVEGHFPYHQLPYVNKDEWVVCRVFNKSSGGIIFNNNNGNSPVQSSPPPEWMDSVTSFANELLENSPPPPLVDPSNIACSNYSSKWEGSDLVEGIHPDDCGSFLISSDGLLPQLPVQNYKPFKNSCYSLHGALGGPFSGGLELQSHLGLSEKFNRNHFSLGDSSLATLSRDEARFEGSEVAGADVNSEGRCGEGGYYGYLESSLMDEADDYDLNLESLMNQENPSFFTN